MNRTCADCRNTEKFIFSDLEPELFDELQAAGTIHRFPRGETIVAAGSPALAVYCVMAGGIKLTRIGERGERQILRLLGHSDILGLRPILAGQDFDVSAEVLENATVCVIPRAVALDMIERSTRFMYRVMEYLAKEIRRSEDILMALTQRPVRRRVADILLLLDGHRVHGDRWEPFKIRHLKRKDIAEAVAVTPETLSRVLAEFAREGLLEVDRREIRLLDPEGLQTVTGEKMSKSYPKS